MRSVHVGAVGLVLAAALAVESMPAAAQSGGEGFLFHRPVVSLGLRLGYDQPRASSDLFQQTMQDLTLDREDFAGTFVGFEVAIPASDRLDVVVSAGHASASSPSEFRDWVDQDDNPITQVTEFATTPLEFGARYYLKPRGRQVGRFAWIPTKMAPFVGGGFGAVRYRWQQTGDFVDFETLDIFTSSIVSEGWAAAAHASAGVDVSLNKHLVLSAEGRYRWARGTLDALRFQGFEKLDLAGLRFTVGISARF